MAEIRETNIEEIRIENHVQLTKVYVGGGNDFIVVSGNDISIVERFIDAGNKIESLAADMDEKISNLESTKENYLEVSKSVEIRKEFSQKAEEIMDGVFGKGSTKKFFADAYEVIPDFLPDVECFIDYFNSLLPVVERLSEHKVKLEKIASRKRMDKYKPKDFKKPGSK